jgi:proteic killer suppression protein
VPIKSFEHKGLRQFFETGSTAGIQAQHAPRLGRMLRALDAAAQASDMGFPGWNLHPLKGDFRGHWAVSVSGNWRLTFRFDGSDAVLIDYLDYH